MKTEVTFKYKNRKHRVVINALNPSNGGAIVRQKFNLDPKHLTIINCIGGFITRPQNQYSIPRHHTHSQP